ncbi:MAG: cupin domain-containing protein [Solirubrobacteraceae bacterium]
MTEDLPSTDRKTVDRHGIDFVLSIATTSEAAMTASSIQDRQPRPTNADEHSHTTHPESASVTRWVAGGRFTELIDDGDYDAQHVEVPAGFATPVHLHTRYAEHLYVVAGSFKFWAAGKVRVIDPGESITVAIGTAHALFAGDRGGKGLIISRPAGFAKVVRDSGTETEAAFDLERFVHAAIEAGDEILDPPA